MGVIENILDIPLVSESLVFVVIAVATRFWISFLSTRHKKDMEDLQNERESDIADLKAIIAEKNKRIQALEIENKELRSK